MRHPHRLRRAAPLLSLLLVLLAPAAARAAELIVTVPLPGFRYYELVMGAAVSTVTIERNPGGAGPRISEQGDTLTLTQPAGGPCTLSGGVIDCSQLPVSSSMTVTNNGGSVVPPARDRVISRGNAHGDPLGTHSPVSVSITSNGGLIEVWTSNLTDIVNGSDIATATAPADIVHSGTSPAFGDLRGGADRWEGGPGADTVVGGAGDDQLLGGAGEDSLTGDAGNDTIRGGTGSDFLKGDAGTDTLSYDDSERTLGLTATFAAGVAGTAGTAEDGTGDPYDASFERLEGTPQGDVLDGGPGGDQLAGMGGDDRVRGRGGADTLDGGAGLDTVDYSERSAARPVNVTLGAPGLGGNTLDDGLGDVLTGFDAVLGSPGADRLTGGSGDERFDGGPGADLIDGAGGTDTVDYAGRADGVVVTVGAGTADDGNDLDGPPGARDDARGVETVLGSAHADRLEGDDGMGTLVGAAGDDVLDGRGGADRLDGGPGRDLASYATRSAGATVSLPAGSGPDGDVLSGVEDLTGGPGADTLTGDDAPNRLDGGDGADVLTGNGAVDEFSAGAGDDELNAKDGLSEVVRCGPGQDRIDIDAIDLPSDCDTVSVVSDRDGDGIPDGSDCAPDNAAIRPGAVEILGNAVDENCDGIAAPQAPVPVVPPVVLSAAITFGWGNPTSSTVVRRIVIAGLRGGETATIRCAGRRCPFKVKRFTKLKKGRRTFGRALLRGRRLLPGAKVSVYVTAPSAIGRSAVLTVRRGKDPKITRACLPAGATKPSRCP